jgi:hypothetical protein
MFIGEPVHGMYPVQSGDNTYMVDPNTNSCSCPAGRYDRRCRHLDAVVMALEEGGWTPQREEEADLFWELQGGKPGEVEADRTEHQAKVPAAPKPATEPGILGANQYDPYPYGKTASPFDALKEALARGHHLIDKED